MNKRRPTLPFLGRWALLARQLALLASIKNHRCLTKGVRSDAGVWRLRGVFQEQTLIKGFRQARLF